MRLANFVRILMVSAAMAGYSSWSLAVREKDKDAVVPADSSAVAGIPLLNLTEAKSLWSDPGALFIDVRSSTDYEFGHVAGAISMPYEEFAERLAARKQQLQGAGAIVVYCKSKDCGKSLWSAIRLHQEGLTQTRIYPNGWNEWDTNGLPRTHGR
ncbi:MAG TPA: rhodanese-like domain-containing protein [Gemmataceae bacterium]|jgi:rhodanese-related sulfurtransferase|nr:rhodanese-like domain-containing protein [Gemmataceae bacterium]